MKKDVDFNSYAGYVLEKMASGGVFLTTKYGNEVNTMTIGWGGINYYWSEPIFEVPVRYSRHTYGLLDKSGVFTVSVPLENDNVKKQLAYCGSHSGRNVNKFTECGLTTSDADTVDVPIIKECSLHFECEVVFKADVNAQNLDSEIDKRCYPDYHTIFFGRIKAAYITCEE